ncbi:hypothetical protein BH24ACT23_BH24ACT23_01230 [soil metagenome]
MNGRALTLFLGGVLAAAGMTAPAASAAEPADPIDPPYTQAEAEAELRDVVEELEETDPVASHPTLELRELALALPALRGKERRKAKAILARPDDGPTAEWYGGGWPKNATPMSAPEDDFIVHWPDVPNCKAPTQGCDEPDLADTSPSNGIPDYIDQVIGAMEESRAIQNVDLGWPDYKDDGSKGGDGKLDVYVADICNEKGGACVFGYASPDDGSAGCLGPPFKCAAYLVIDNDYNFGEFGYEDPGIPLEVTTAHEYNHILQFNLDSLQDTWMFESTATWSEEKTFPDDDDWLFYTDFWASSSRSPLTGADGGRGLKIYGAAVWNHWIENGYSKLGPGVVLDAWEVSRDVSPQDNAVAAYNRALKDLPGGMNFSRQFADFATATAEWKTGEGNFPDAAKLADMKRFGKLRLNGTPLETTLDNTAYQLIDVNPKGADKIKLKAKIQKGVRSAIALIARDGSKTGGNALIDLSFRRKGGKAKAVLLGAQGYERITAVAVNADGRLKNSGFNYRKNNQTFKLKLR